MKVIEINTNREIDISDLENVLNMTLLQIAEHIVELDAIPMQFLHFVKTKDEIKEDSWMHDLTMTVASQYGDQPITYEYVVNEK